MSRPELDAIQWPSLLELLGQVLETNPFYRIRWAEAGLGKPPADRDDFLRRAPFTTKGELVEDQLKTPPFGTNLTFPLRRYCRYSQTSGSSGAPIRWLDTAESWDWMLGNWARVLEASGVTPEDRLFAAFSFGPFLGFWTAFEAAARLGCLCIPGGGMSSEARVQTILDTGATVLCCTPTYAIRLGETLREQGLDPGRSRVRRILTAGEPGGCIPATRDRIESLWPGAAVRDHHGMTEVGPASYECPVRSGVLHVIGRSFLAEVHEPGSGRAVPPGHPGELVLTNLGRLGSPLIRYRTGDLVQASSTQPCACGSSELALEGGILSRLDEMVVVRGVNLYPSAVEALMRECVGSAEYRVDVDLNVVPAAVSIELEAGSEPDRDLAARVEVMLKAATHLRIPVSVVPVGSLPRHELKARRWMVAGKAAA